MALRRLSILQWSMACTYRHPNNPYYLYNLRNWTSPKSTSSLDVSSRCSNPSWALSHTSPESADGSAGACLGGPGSSSGSLEDRLQSSCCLNIYPADACWSGMQLLLRCRVSICSCSPVTLARGPHRADLDPLRSNRTWLRWVTQLGYSVGSKRNLKKVAVIF